MKLYRFYRLDRKGQPLRQVEDIQCASDLQARLKGREILGVEENVASLDIWDGERRVAQLAQGAPGTAAPDQGGASPLGLGDEIDEDTKFGRSVSL